MNVISRQPTVKRTLVFFLVPDFTMLPFAAAVETLRIANRMLGYTAYNWRLCSADGERVCSSAGIAVEVNSSVADERKNLGGESRPNMVLVCSGIDIEQYGNKTVNAWLRETYNRGIAVGSLCTGAHVLAQAGLLNGKRCAIHWENLPGFSEAFPQAEVYADLYEVDGNIYTCAGGTASLDMMLNLIGQDFGENLVNRICEQQLTDRVRNPHDRQRLPLRARLGVQNTKVLSIIELMENNLSEPLSLVEIADDADLSRRQIERLFRQEMGRSPARYYLEIRLDRARHLLVQSSMPVVEVAVACGFVSASHFSKCYREVYNRSPQQERAERKLTIASSRTSVAA
ncbi:MAG: GlxA family transcriptional regulator [Alphaproteobacteria bacterium]|nr:GlxA family transcriptional regulator [Pseudorhizobium pelagicum]MBU1315346.1 GlxA family transcriptional regulator [Alphaproteobacteria bacterium]MDY6961825.1 GlxA family transcriptional regulator [Pseudomonadota bacterium]MBU1550677.1 GlxA family transcriptional regulator [Alphaproteobacteria bacterium]MBU2338813.1 GlxA family transcriptional regulator [Alphaproteobacteria bacterium]MBU2386904.1 GlxA family transcriptional regulator [Alphaproteobacteria bacterium]|tara:strand:- start:2896 stop:3924 length:1029 start_codon:yes stop_codon:yes gene_type:complete